MNYISSYPYNYTDMNKKVECNFSVRFFFFNTVFEKQIVLSKVVLMIEIFITFIFFYKPSKAEFWEGLLISHINIWNMLLKKQKGMPNSWLQD